MNITNNREVMIFRNDYQDRAIYNVGLSKKLQDGNYENGTILCQFKKDVSLPNQTKIMIKNAWLTFYKNKDNHTVPYMFINEFTTTAETNERTDLGKAIDKQYEDKAYIDFGNSVELTDDDLEIAF